MAFKARQIGPTVERPFYGTLQCIHWFDSRIVVLIVQDFRSLTNIEAGGSCSALQRPPDRFARAAHRLSADAGRGVARRYSANATGRLPFSDARQQPRVSPCGNPIL
jgi:hypothetical protein